MASCVCAITVAGQWRIFTALPCIRQKKSISVGRESQGRDHRELQAKKMPSATEGIFAKCQS